MLTVNDYSLLNMDNCTFTGNNAVYLIVGRPDFSIWNCTFTDNNSNVLDLWNMDGNQKLIFNNCTFNNNFNTTRDDRSTFSFYYFDDEDLDLTFTDCNLGNSTFDNREFAKFVNQLGAPTDQPVNITINPMGTIQGTQIIPEETTPVESTPEETTPEELTPPLEGTILNGVSVLNGNFTSVAIALLALGISVVSLVATIALKKKSSANSK